MDRYITFTEVDTTTAAEETVTGTTIAPEATYVPEEGVVKETEGSASEEFVLTVGAAESGDVLLMTGEEAQETTATTQAPASLSFQPMNFVTNLQYMGVGMLTIFIVIGVIIVATQLINKTFSKK